MPGKNPDHALRNQRLSKNSSGQTFISHDRPSIPDSPLDALNNRVAAVFEEAQSNVASHRKLAVSLRRIQEACIDGQAVEGGKNVPLSRFTERDFGEVFVSCILQVLCVKKSESVGDKTVRFVGQFLKHASDRDIACLDSSLLAELVTITETPTARLGNQVLTVLIQLLPAKEKTVRYRATQVIAHIINSLDAIDDDHFILLRMSLLKRMRDKEAIVRVQAVMGLVRLAGSDDEEGEQEDSDDENGNGLLTKLVDILQNDPSSEVRRALLLNLPLTPTTLPFLLERARDQDAATRRALYSRLLPALADFRHLSLSMREKLLRWGLRDRDENVRKATAELFRRRWIEDCVRPAQGEHDEMEATSPNQPSMDPLLELLERIDIVNSGVEEGIGKQAMNEFWEGRQDYWEDSNFEDPFWNDLSPESVFIARTWNDFTLSRSNKAHGDLTDGRIPEVTRLAFCLERYIHELTRVLRTSFESGAEPEETIDNEFIVEQLLHIAKTLDYSDEIGRRKMFALMRETLAIAELPEEITKLVVDVLRDICGGEASDERDFCGIVLEIIAEIHDNIFAGEGPGDNEDESFHSARSEISDKPPTEIAVDSSRIPARIDDDENKAIREIMINMKCLHIAQCMLQNVEGALQSNMHLVHMLNNLIVPAIRSQEAPVRERGLLCLGLCCLLDKNLAAENLTLFAHCFSKGHEMLQTTAIQTVSDILESHPSLFTGADVDPTLQKMILKMLAKGIKASSGAVVQQEAVAALCKLLLVGVLDDKDLLQQAVVLFFESCLTEHEGARQALSYSLPVYCYSRRENMERMAQAAGGVLLTIMGLNEDSGDKEDTISIARVGSVLADWTDARKLVIADKTAGFWTEAAAGEASEVNGDAHLILAGSLLERSLHHDCPREDRKAIFGIIGKLQILAGSSKEQLLSVRSAVLEAIDEQIASDATSKTALNKFCTVLDKVLDDGKVMTTSEQEATVKALPIDSEIGDVPLDERTRDLSVEDSVLDELLEDEDD